MKTNILMQVTIGNYTQPIEHKTMMGDLNSLWAYGNGLRVRDGYTPLELKQWLTHAGTVEFMLELEKKYNVANCNIIKIKTDAYGRKFLYEGGWTVLQTKRGKGGGTWAHLILLLKAASYLSPSFEIELYETFINNKILQWRDDSGNEFINLNIAIDAYLPGREGKDNKGVFIAMAKLLKAKIKPDEDSWDKASFNQLEHRATIERDLCKYLKMGMIRDFEHLKEVALESD